MDIDRNKQQLEAKMKVKFCLDQLEKAKEFSPRIYWGTYIVHRLTVEEIIGALVAAEQVLKQ